MATPNDEGDGDMAIQNEKGPFFDVHATSPTEKLEVFTAEADKLPVDPQLRVRLHSCPSRQRLAC